MSYVDFILNMAGLLLWLNWRSIRFDPLTKRTPATLMGTLRPAAPKKLRRWHLLLFIAGLIFLRALVYRFVTPFWVGKLNFDVAVIPFRSDDFGRIFLFSFLSFAQALGIFYTILLLLSLLKGPENIHRFVKIPLGRVDGWPRAVKIILPLVVMFIAWWSLSWLPIFPTPVSTAQHIEQSLVIGLDSYLSWKFPLAAILILHLVNSYVYFGKHPFWNYVNILALKILSPLKKIPLHAGRMDFAPVIGIALVFLAAEFAGRGLNLLYARLPF